MIHDQQLVDRLSRFPTERFRGDVFRATRVSSDPTAPSISGGRWSPPPQGDPGVSVLYTSLERDGAIAEIVSFLAQLTPVPGPRQIKVTRLSVTIAETMRLAHTDLSQLGVDLSCYGDRDYPATQEIGAALTFLGLDGLIAPSARWPCDNLMIFVDNHKITERLEPISEEQVEWTEWAKFNGFNSQSGDRSD